VEARRPLRVVYVSPEPTPYRAPLFDRIAQRLDVELEVLYAASTVAGRTWSVPLDHPHRVLAGIAVPGARRVLRHDYPLTPAVWGELSRAAPDVVVVSGWSTFAAQAAIAWCRLHRVPYLLAVESHDRDPRPGWRRAVKGAVVPRVVRAAAGVLVTGTLARESMLARGARPDRIRVFANTIDVTAFAEHAERIAPRRAALRSDIGIRADEVAVVCVARLSSEKELGTLIRAVSLADDARLVLVLAGDGPQRAALARLAAERGVRVRFLGDVPWEAIVEVYVVADVFAMLSSRETWGVVVNEAAAVGLPLVLSDGVGAAHDIVEADRNGVVVPIGDADAAGAALRRLAADASLRRSWGEASRRIVSAWGYAPSVEGFVELVRLAAAARNG
jgi:glycosyltransferase involved in cell wall biosynthesis